jgi:hypothetical protein
MYLLIVSSLFDSVILIAMFNPRRKITNVDEHLPIASNESKIIYKIPKKVLENTPSLFVKSSFSLGITVKIIEITPLIKGIFIISLHILRNIP